jgi:tetratricopeptide (TPR) repeat protein
LTYKRQGEYTQEEALYREALKIDPMDDHVLNNLAVNLAHQGRGEEALRIMDELEKLTPDDPYADLHRAKIFATMGKRDKAYKYLKKALEGTALLDTLHHIEFRQDIRIDPAFRTMRHEEKFQELLRRLR